MCRVAFAVFLGFGLASLGSAASSEAGEVQQMKDQETGWMVYTACAGKTCVSVVPQAGCNVFSIVHDGQEMLKKPKSLKDLPGFMYGNPVCYPTPNRVANAEFLFEGKTYKFPANNGKNFLHGLVHSAAWEYLGAEASATETTLHNRIVFKEGTEWFKLFPFAHTFKLAITVKEGAVKFTYTVENTGTGPVPFGLAFHPWFLYQGSRAQTFLQVPAKHIYEVSDPSPTGLIPTGKLLDLEGNPHDLRTARTLEDFVIDDVFEGMTPEKPAVIDFREVHLKLTLPASADFTHMVVYTPKEPWFCVENQTCSTDAINLQPKLKEANLIVVAPGKSHTGTAEFQFAKY
jgi:aldose 1-epimerase